MSHMIIKFLSKIVLKHQKYNDYKLTLEYKDKKWK